MKNKTIVLGVTGGIAVYKVAGLARELTQLGADVHVIMTQNATEFVTPLTFETLTANPVCVDTFDRNFQWNVQHVALAKRADLFVIAPATANIIAKMATGIADDMLSTTVLAAKCPKLIAPAMNTGMWENPVTIRNVKLLTELGIHFVSPEAGKLANGDMGFGRLAELDKIRNQIDYLLTPKDLLGRKILVTAGATRESLDPVRFITNHSTGKMGYELAKAAYLRGGTVTLVSGRSELPKPLGVEVVEIGSAKEMAQAVLERSDEFDIIIKAAAVADYRPKIVSTHKIKKTDDSLTVQLEKTEDILKSLGSKRKQGQILCGFSMETENLVENSTQKLYKKKVDMIVANNLNEAGAGFGVDTNIVTLITKEQAEQLEKISKFDLANIILTKLNTL